MISFISSSSFAQQILYIYIFIIILKYYNCRYFKFHATMQSSGDCSDWVRCLLTLLTNGLYARAWNFARGICSCVGILQTVPIVCSRMIFCLLSISTVFLPGQGESSFLRLYTPVHALVHDARYENETELSKYVWKLKRNERDFDIKKITSMA